MTVIIGRVCTVCAAKGVTVIATHVATNAEGGQWYECGEHGAGDHAKVFGGGFMRLKLESAEDFFKRVFDVTRGKKGE
jgi:hypothetical protein